VTGYGLPQLKTKEETKLHDLSLRAPTSLKNYKPCCCHYLPLLVVVALPGCPWSSKILECIKAEPHIRTKGNLQTSGKPLLYEDGFRNSRLDRAARRIEGIKLFYSIDFCSLKEEGEKM
jgi:hypothetical protein